MRRFSLGLWPWDQGGSNRELRKQGLTSLSWGIWVEGWLRGPRCFQVLGGQRLDQPEEDTLWQVGGAVLMEDLDVRGMVQEGTLHFASRGLGLPQGTGSLGHHWLMAKKGALFYYFLF